MTDSPKRPDSREARTRRGPTSIGQWTLYPDLGVLRSLSGEVRLNDKTLHVLLVLLDAGDGGVSRDALLDRVWGESYPSDAVISRAIADLRAAFGEKAGEQKYIRTLPKYGYQFVATHRPARMPPPREAKPESAGPRRLPFLIGATALMVIAGWFAVRYQAPPLPSATIVFAGQRPLTSAPGLEHQPRFLPDGASVIYAALRPGRNDWDIFRVGIDAMVSQPVAVTPGVNEHGPAISPGAEEVAYVRMEADDCQVVVQSVALGVPQAIAACTNKFATVVDWSPVSDELAYTIAENDESNGLRRIYLVDRYSGVKRPLTRDVSPTGTDFYPRFSPSGSKLAFLRGEPQPDHRTTIWVIDLETGSETQYTTVPAQTGGMTWLDDAKLLYSVSDGGPMRGRWIDLQTGISRPIESAEFMHPDYSTGHNRLIVAEPRNDSDLAVLTMDGKVSTVVQSTGDDHHGSLSPQEDWVAFVSGRSGNDELWLAATEGDQARRLTQFDGARVRYPDWHPDGQRILFTAQTDAGEKLYEVDVVSGAARQIETDFEEITTPRWLADGSGWIAGCRNGSTWSICSGGDAGARNIVEGFFRPRPAHNGQVYVVDSGGKLFELSLSDGQLQEKWNGLPADGRFAWAVQNDSVYLLAGSESGSNSRLIRYDLEDGNTTLLHEGRMPLADMNLSIGRKTGIILFTQLQTSSDDVVLYEILGLD